MEVRRAMFLRARDDGLAKIAYPLALGVFGKLSRTGTEWISKWRAATIELSRWENRGEIGMFAEDDVEIKDTEQQN